MAIAALFVFWGRTLSISNESLPDEPLREVKLDNKHRGELAELAFMRKAASLGFAVAKPWGESDRYDVIVRTGKIFWRVQVKSVWAKSPKRNYYRIKLASKSRASYTADEIDFLVGYIFPEDTWYIFPAATIENCKAVHVAPDSKHSPYKQYHEAWKLMKPASVEPGAEAAVPETPPAAEITDDPG